MKFNHLVWLAAFVLAACAAFVSVFGLGQLFAGAGAVVLVMVGGLEFAKLVAASALHRYWDELPNLTRILVTPMVIIMISITSIGIYGFLSNGYQKTANLYEIEASQSGIYESKKALFEKRIIDNDKIVENKNKRSETLSDLRTNQEGRLDSLDVNNKKSIANKVRNDIEKANEEITKLSLDIDKIMLTNQILSDSVNVYNMKIMDIKAKSSVAAELGPLKILSDFTGWEMSKVVNWLIIVIMCVFDPMAVSLLIMANSIMMIEGDKKTKSEPNSNSEWFEALTDKFKKAKVPDDYLVDTDIHRDVWVPVETVPPTVPPIKGDLKSTVDKVLEMERAKKVDKTNRGFSVEVPEPRVLGKTWVKKK